MILFLFMFNFNSHLNMSLNFHPNLYFNFHIYRIFIPNLNHHLKVHLILHNLEEEYHILYNFTK